MVTLFKRQSILVLILALVSANFGSLGFTQVAVAAPGASLPTVAEAQYAVTHNAFSIPFVQNKGRLAGTYRYSAQTFLGTIGVNKQNIDYNLGGNNLIQETAVGGSFDPGPGQESPTRVNIFQGSDPNNWKTDIKTYDEISLGEVFPGTEVTLRAFNSNIEKILTVRPRANPNFIAFKIKNNNIVNLNILTTGELHVGFTNNATAGFNFTKPVAYQIINNQNVNVDVAYRLIDPSTYTFTLGNYDKNYPLVIDPAFTTLSAGTYLGGSAYVVVNGISIAAGGGVFVYGYTTSNNLPALNGYQNAISGTSDMFVAKFNAGLSNMSAATYIGGTDAEYPDCNNVIVDANGRVYITGDTYSKDFPVVGGAQGQARGAREVVVARLSNNLSRLQASTYFGGSTNDFACGIALDSAGNVFVSGFTASAPDFPTTPGAYQTSTPNRTGTQAFIAKFNPNLSSILAATYLSSNVSSNHIDRGNPIAIDAGNNVYIGGTTATNFPATQNAAQKVFAGGWDGFVAKFDNNLTTLQAATLFGGAGDDDDVTGIAVDPAGNKVFVSGMTNSNNLPNTNGGGQAAFAGGRYDAFVTSLATDLSAINQTSYFGGAGDEYARANVIVDGANGNVFLAGSTNSVTLPSTNGAFQTAKKPGNTNSGFMTKLNNGLTSITNTSYFGGSNFESISGSDIRNNFFYIAGSTGSNDLPLGPNPALNVNNGGGNAIGFISRFNKN